MQNKLNFNRYSYHSAALGEATTSILDKTPPNLQDFSTTPT